MDIKDHPIIRLRDALGVSSRELIDLKRADPIGFASLVKEVSDASNIHGVEKRPRRT